MTTLSAVGNYAIAINGGFYLAEHGRNGEATLACSREPANARRFSGQKQAQTFADEHIGGSVRIVRLTPIDR
jgi:hypothetical protein